MITRVTLKNWRSHKDTVLDFIDGTNALIGIMGSGKTSALDAICFGLFGTFPALQSKRARLEDVITKKPKEEKRSEVAVDFTLGGDDYSVKRTIESGRSTAELRKNSKLIEAPQPQKVTEEVERLLKVDYDLFTRAIYSEQNQLDMFLTIPRGQRMKKIDQLLSIDRFEQARASAVALANRLKSSISEKQRMLFSMKSDDSIRSLPAMRHELEVARADRLRLHEQLRQALQSRDAASQRVAYLKGMDNERRRIEEEIRTSIALINSTNEDIERLSNELKDYVERQDEDIQKEMDSFREMADMIKASVDAERRKLDDAKQMGTIKDTKIRLIEGEKIPELEAKVREKRGIEEMLGKGDAAKIALELRKKLKDIEDARNGLARAAAGAEEVEKSIGEFRSVEDSCPVCDQRLSKEKKAAILKKKREKLADLRKLIGAQEKSVIGLDEERMRLEAAVRDYDKLQERLVVLADSDRQLKFLKEACEQLGKELKKHRSEAKAAEAKIRSIEKDYEKEMEKIRWLNDILAKRTEAQEKARKIKRIEVRLNELQTEKNRFLGISPEDLERAEKELQSFVGLEKGIEARIDGMEAVMGERQKRISDAEGKAAAAERYESDIRRVEAVTDQMHLFESALSATQEQLRLNFVSAVNQAMQMVWQDLYPYRDFYSARLGIIDGDYVLQLQDSTGWSSVDGLISGGERSIACLALRIAFSLVLAPQMRMLVLDEPTHNLDAKAVEDLGNVLRERMGEFVEQVFLITHDTALEGAVSGYLYKFDRAKESDGPTQVTRISGN